MSTEYDKSSPKIFLVNESKCFILLKQFCDKTGTYLKFKCMGFSYNDFKLITIIIGFIIRHFRKILITSVQIYVVIFAYPDSNFSIMKNPLVFNFKIKFTYLKITYKIIKFT